jgi:hypothetical protein
MATFDEFHRAIPSKDEKYPRPGSEPTFYNAQCVPFVGPFDQRIWVNGDRRPEEPL